MRRFGKYLALGMLSFSVVGVAGHSVGNGGDVVICSSDIETFEVLDLHEGRVLFNLELDLGSNKMRVMDKLSYALEKLARLDDEFASLLERRSRFMFASPPLPSRPWEIDDAGSVSIQPGCVMRQLAMQIRISHADGEEVKLVVEPNFWSKLDLDNKAILYLHELVFSYAIDRGHNSSERARQFVRLLISRQINSINQADYLDLKCRLGFGCEQ